MIEGKVRRKKKKDWEKLFHGQKGVPSSTFVISQHHSPLNIGSKQCLSTPASVSAAAYLCISVWGKHAQGTEILNVQRTFTVPHHAAPPPRRASPMAASRTRAIQGYPVADHMLLHTNRQHLLRMANHTELSRAESITSLPSSRGSPLRHRKPCHTWRPLLQIAHGTGSNSVRRQSRTGTSQKACTPTACVSHTQAKNQPGGGCAKTTACSRTACFQ